MAEELFALLTEAKTVYLQEVKIYGKQYCRYVEDFVNSHRYIDCNNAVCRNCHEMNIHIVKGLLTDCPHLIQPLFSTPSLSFEECMELKRKYDTSELASSDCNPAKFSFLSFDCSLSREQLAGIVSCANTYHLFCSSVTIDDMESLFSCKRGFSLRVNSVRRVAILFDALLEHSFIQAQWQTVLSKGKFLRTKDGKGLRLRGKGLPSVNRYGVGDLLVNVSVYVPESLNTEEKRTIEKLGSSKNFAPTQSVKEKIFSKLRHMFD